MTEAAPTVVCKSLAIWGKRESVERTIAWAAKAAQAKMTMARVALPRGGAGFSGKS